MFQCSRSYCFERVFCTSDPSWECGGFKEILPKFSKLPAPEIESQRPNGCEECSTGHAAHPCRAPSQVKYQKTTIRMAKHRSFAVQCVHFALGPTEQYNIATRTGTATISQSTTESTSKPLNQHNTTSRTTTPEPQPPNYGTCKSRTTGEPARNLPRPETTSPNHLGLFTTWDPARNPPGRCIQAITDHIS